LAELSAVRGSARNALEPVQRAPFCLRPARPARFSKASPVKCCSDTVKQIFPLAGEVWVKSVPGKCPPVLHICDGPRCPSHGQKTVDCAASQNMRGRRSLRCHTLPLGHALFCFCSVVFKDQLSHNPGTSRSWCGGRRCRSKVVWGHYAAYALAKGNLRSVPRRGTIVFCAAGTFRPCLPCRSCHVKQGLAFWSWRLIRSAVAG